MSQVRFEHIEYLWLLLVIVPLAGLYVWKFVWQKKGIERFGDLPLMKKLLLDYSVSKQNLKFLLFVAGMLFLILGIANLQFGSKMEKAKREGVDIVIALDLSRSMLAEDIKPDRLENAKQFVYQLLSKLENDRVGIVVFAGKAYVQMPLTVDYSAAKLFLSDLNVNMIPTQGTNFADAIEMANSLFREGEKKYKVLIIISDGENNEGELTENARKAISDGVKIFTVGVGSPMGAPIPVYSGGVQVDYKKDQNGSIVLSKLGEETMQKLASMGGGKYYHISNSDFAVKGLLKDLAKTEKKEIDTRVFADYESKFQYFLLIALIFLLLDLIIFERKSKFRFNLFGFKQEDNDE